MTLHRCEKSHDCENDPIERRMWDKCEAMRKSLARARESYEQACDELTEYRRRKRD